MSISACPESAPLS
jgi:invasion protein IalB